MRGKNIKDIKLSGENTSKSEIEKFSVQNSKTRIKNWPKGFWPVNNYNNSNNKNFIIII